MVHCPTDSASISKTAKRVFKRNNFFQNSRGCHPYCNLEHPKAEVNFLQPTALFTRLDIVRIVNWLFKSLAFLNAFMVAYSGEGGVAVVAPQYCDKRLGALALQESTHTLLAEI